jgi:hypothetical protein
MYSDFAPALEMNRAGPFLHLTAFVRCAGSCCLNFQLGMQLEHCSRAGCNLSIRTTNYGLITTPRREWRLVLGEEAAGGEDLLFNRRIPCYKKLGDLEVAKTARLTSAEIIAVVLYTGPMVSTPQLEHVICACCFSTFFSR